MRLPSGREDSGWNWITGGARFFRATSQRQHHSACKIDHGLVNMAQPGSLDRAAGWGLNSHVCIAGGTEGTRRRHRLRPSTPVDKLNLDAHLKKACYLEEVGRALYQQ